MTMRPKGVAIFVIPLLILSLIAFYSKSPLVFFRFDGSQLLIMAAMQRDWGIGVWNFTSNPIKGIGGMDLPQHNLTDPSLWLAAHLPPSIGPVISMALYAVILAA